MSSIIDFVATAKRLGKKKRRKKEGKEDDDANVRPAPFFKAVGGKRQLITELLPHMPMAISHYFEPFVGGGALFFELQSTGRFGYATLNDANPHMMAAYEAVRDHVDSLIDDLREYARCYADTGEDFFYERRAAQPDPVKRPRDAAARFLFLNRTCFNGLYRVNKSGQFNVPHGRYTNPTICDEPALRAASAALRGVDLHCGTFLNEQVPPSGAFYYFDPPYWPASKTADFTSYTSDGFGSEDQEMLRDHALRLKSHGARVLLSNADVEPVRKLYARGFEIRRVEARRAVNSDATKRGKVGELLLW